MNFVIPGCLLLKRQLEPVSYMNTTESGGFVVVLEVVAVVACARPCACVYAFFPLYAY